MGDEGEAGPVTAYQGPPPDDRDLIVSNLEACWSSLGDLLDGLSDDDWDVASLCPDWTVHGAVSHLAAVEHVLVGWRPSSVETPLPFDRAVDFVTEATSMSGPELRDRYREIVATRRGELAGMDDADFAVPSPTPVGPGTYGRFMAIREFDFWVHERDMRVPLDRPTDDGGDPAAMALGEVHRSLGYIVGKRIGVPDGGSIRFDLHGGLDARLAAVVEGRARVVDPAEVTDPTVTVHSDFLTFMLLACGRIDPAEPMADGRISWSGDDTLGRTAASSLRFTF